jgi:hypothetical protein
MLSSVLIVAKPFAFILNAGFSTDTDGALDFPSLHQRFQPTSIRMPKSASVRFNLDEPDSDYASVASTTPHDGPHSYSNPNYLGPDVAQLLSSPPDSLLQDPTGRFHSQVSAFYFWPISSKI